MIVSGFFQQVFDRITIESVREALGEAIGRRDSRVRLTCIDMSRRALRVATSMSDFVRVAKVSDVPDPGKMLVEVDDGWSCCSTSAASSYASTTSARTTAGRWAKGTLDGSHDRLPAARGEVRHPHRRRP